MTNPVAAMTVPLFADISSLLSVLFVLFSIVVWIINQVAAKNQEANKKAPARPQPRPVKAQQEQPEDEIDTFLRRASQKRGEQPQGRPTPARGNAGKPGLGGRRPGAPVEGRMSGERADDPRAPLSKPMPSLTGPKPPAARTPSVPAQVQSLIRQEEKDVRPPAFGFQSSLEQVDESTEARLHSTFDHEVGSLGSSLLSSSDDDRVYGSTITGSKASPQNTPGRSDFAKLLMSPDGLRNAIVMQEILKPRGLD